MAPDHVKARDIFRVSVLPRQSLFPICRLIFVCFIWQRAKLLKTKKEEGNEAFKAGRYQEAHDLYTDTLTIDPNNKLTNAKVYFNRAVVLVKVCNEKIMTSIFGYQLIYILCENFQLGKLKEALSDCNRAIELDETYLKAYLRRAKTHMDLEQFEEAVRDYEKINKMEKNRGEL